VNQSNNPLTPRPTSNDKHTPTPWEARGNVIFIKGSNKSIATVHVQNNFDINKWKPIDDVEAEANAARIVQCVNACEGMGDLEKYFQEMKDIGVKQLWIELESIRSEKAELIEALRLMAQRTLAKYETK
jgi:hypothetical protein